MANNPQWHAQSVREALEALSSSERGLSAADAASRLKIYGANKLPEDKAPGALILFFGQFQSPLIYLLFAASAAVFVVGEAVDGLIILFVLSFNALVGSIQEGKAQNTLRALKKFAETKATVFRNEREVIISDEDVVPGDIVILQEGEKIPADARIIVSNSMNIEEAAMTGESEPVHKDAGMVCGADTEVADRKNMAFKGTHVVSGNGTALVVATGSETVIGTIAQQIASIHTDIPLKVNIRHLSRAIIFSVAGIGSALFGIGLAQGKSAAEMFLAVVSLSVSIIPEGLPIVVTLILATGAWRMGRRNALIKKLQAVEALGQARVIALDKTGTITKNELVIQKVYLPAHVAEGGGVVFEIGGVGYDPKGEVRLRGNLTDPIGHATLALAGKIAAYCASARVVFSQETNQWQIAGDPTEAAMLVFARKLGFHKNEMEREFPITAEIPFNSSLQYHAVVHGKEMLTVVGSPEAILKISNTTLRGGEVFPFWDGAKNEAEQALLEMSREGLRVIAFAKTNVIPDVLSPETVQNLTFVGLFGMKDSIRPEVAQTTRVALAAGIRVVMITGDHRITAEAIAKEAGIYREGDGVLTGNDIDALSDGELAKVLVGVTVFARVTPEHKLRIVRAYQARGEIVAMTGDGVNDAPSLVAADLGVAMGKIGTEVAKEAADIVLLDDNFASIVAAVEEGRSIYKAIQKVLLYLFSTSMGEVLVITGALLLGYPLPLGASQIIWLNFVTDGFLDVALAMDPKEGGLLSGTFARPNKYLIDARMVKRMFVMALPMAVGTLALFQGNMSGDIIKAWTVSLTVLAAFQWFNAWNCRSEHKSIFRTNPFSNMFLVGATCVVVALQLLAVYNPSLQGILHTTALTRSDWILIVPVAASIVVVEEARKYLRRRHIAKERSLVS